MAISSASVMGADTSIQQGFAQFAQAMQQQQQLKQQGNQFDAELAEKKRQYDENVARTNAGAVQLEQASKEQANLDLEAKKIEVYTNQFNNAMSDTNRVGTALNPVANKAAYDSGVNANIIPKEVPYEEWAVASAPSQPDFDLYSGATAERDYQAYVQNLNADNAIAKANAAQTKANEDARLELDWEKLNRESLEGTIDDPMASASELEKSTMAALTKGFSEVLSGTYTDKKGKLKTYALKDIAKNKGKMQSQVDAYNKIANTYGMRPMLLKELDDAVETYGPNWRQDYYLGYDPDWKPPVAASGTPGVGSTATGPSFSYVRGNETLTSEQFTTLKEKAFLNEDPSIIAGYNKVANTN